jgi:membrane dipeptidase
MFDRRNFLKALALLAATPMLAAQAGENSAADDSRRLYRKSVVIDGNLGLASDPAQPIPADMLAAIRSCGLTAIKTTIGGSGARYADTVKELDDYDTMFARYPDLFMPIRSASDIAIAKRSGRIGIIFSFEGVTMLEDKLARIDEFSKRGVRVMQLSYNLPSAFASGVLSPQPSKGLTPLGREAIARMNALGVSLDLSHADAKSTFDAIHACCRPVLITHGGCAAVYAHPRNKTDAELRAVAGTGGVFGIYDPPYISSGPAQQNLDDYMAHVSHALKVCGEDHVGIGSDTLLTGFDTSAESIASYEQLVATRKAAGIGAPGEERPPYVAGLNRADRYAVIASALLKRGYSARITEKVLGANFARVFAAT